MQLHLIDGTYELFRAYYGAPSASNSAGQEVGATRGLLRSLAALLRDPDCTHVAIAFDHVVESFRNDLFEGYKTGEGIEPELADQFSLAEEAARALGLAVWPMIEFEADDALASAAHRFRELSSVKQILICSPDKDLAQCVTGDDVVLWDRMRDRIINEAGVQQKWGIKPTSMPDWLALVGDPADGIPGIPRWGAKSASLILGAYDHIEEIPLEASDWSVKLRGAAGLAQRLAEQRDDALLYKRLATLREDVPLPEDLKQLKWQGARRADLQDLTQRLGEPRLLDRISQWQDD